MPQRMLTETQQQRNERGAWTKADAILQWLHDQVAEDLAESVRVAGEGDEVPASTRPSRLPQEPGIAFKDELCDCGVRWLPPGTTLAEMLDLGVTFFARAPSDVLHVCEVLSHVLGEKAENTIRRTTQ